MLATDMTEKPQKTYQRAPGSEANSNQHRDLISELRDDHQDWFLDAGVSLEMTAGEVLIQQGTEVDAFYFLIEGLMKVHQADQVDRNITMIAPGQLVGEMSFIERIPAAVSVSVVERAMLLRIPYSVIEDKMDSDGDFQATFQKALLGVLSNRLRATSGRLSAFLESEKILDRTENTALISAVESLKKFPFFSSECEIKKQNAGFQENAAKVVESWNLLVKLMNDTIGDHIEGNLHEKDAIGYKIQQELAPYVYMSSFLSRSYTKPRGYAGDYLTIAQVYDDKPIGTGKTGELLDRISLASPPCMAVKNRRTLMSKEIFKTINGNNGDPTNITSFASGPAQELFDVYQVIENPENLRSHLIDIDLKALSFVSDKIENATENIKMDLHNANLIYLALGRKTLSLPPQDLVYSIGLIDYFNDQLVVKLINYAHTVLKPGGKIILGNFHPKNALKAFMDYVLDWRLIHRSEEDMNRLFQASNFSRPCTEVQYEEEGINLFAFCVK